MRRRGLAALLIVLTALASGCWPFQSGRPESKAIRLEGDEPRVVRKDGTTVPFSEYK